MENSAAPRAGTVDPAFAKGKLTKVTSAVSETRYTQFDHLGRLLQMEQRTPVTGETLSTAVPRVSSYQYNFSGALIKETYPSGRVVQNEFEADGDLSRIYGKASHSTATEQTYANSFTYTADGKIERLRLGNRRWEWAKFNARLQVKELETNKEIAVFSFVDFENKKRMFAEFGGKYVLLDFWGIGCVDCRRELPFQIAAYKKFRDRNFEILGLDSDELENSKPSKFFSPKTRSPGPKRGSTASKSARNEIPHSSTEQLRNARNNTN